MEFWLNDELYYSNFGATPYLTCKLNFISEWKFQMIFESKVIKHCLAKQSALITEGYCSMTPGVLQGAPSESEEVDSWPYMSPTLASQLQHRTEKWGRDLQQLQPGTTESWVHVTAMAERSCAGLHLLGWA